MSAEPRYETAAGLLSRTGRTDSLVCLDCGAFVMDTAAHTRSHSISNAMAWSLAVLKTSHVAEHVHDKYDVVERIDSRKFDSWSAEALAEVAASNGLDDASAGPDGGSLTAAGEGERTPDAAQAAVAAERERILRIAERLKEPHAGPRSSGAEYAVPLSLLRAELAPEPQRGRLDCGTSAGRGTP